MHSAVILERTTEAGVIVHSEPNNALAEHPAQHTKQTATTPLPEYTYVIKFCICGNKHTEGQHP